MSGPHPAMPAAEASDSPPETDETELTDAQETLSQRATATRLFSRARRAPGTPCSHLTAVRLPQPANQLSGKTCRTREKS